MSASEGRIPKILSCVSCRQRKIKCDKAQPNCNNCAHANLRCNYPSRKPTRRVPRPRQNELLDRISRLESIVAKANPGNAVTQDGMPPGEGESLKTKSQPRAKTKVALDQTPSADMIRTKSISRSIDQSAEETASRYMGGDFWVNLCEEVEGIKQALEEPSEDEDDPNEEDIYSQGTTPSASSDIAHAFIFNNATGKTKLASPHPTRATVIKLWNIYCRNVDPIIKILHRPTITREISIYFDSIFSDPLPAHKSALFFAIYFAAVTSTSSAECLRQFGEKRDDLRSKLRDDVEHALLMADFLNTNDLAVLQATTIYVAALRVSLRTRAPWVIVAMLVRIAQGMNLHRDGDGRSFSPFVAEIRRRVWCVIINLDLRASEDRGTAAILSKASSTIKPPTPIDDDDFGPESPGPLIPKENGSPENIILILFSRLVPFGYISHPYIGADDSGKGHLHTEDELIQLVRSLESEFIHNADLNSPAACYASEVTRLCILKLWLIVQYPFSHKPVVAPMHVSRETMLRTAVSILELNLRMTGQSWAERFGWWTETFPQWHPLSVALAELCVQTEGDLFVRAWAAIDIVFPLWRELVADAANGPLWRPVKKLYRKAKEARLKTEAKRSSAAAKPAQAPMPQSAPVRTPSSASFMTTPRIPLPTQHEAAQDMKEYPTMDTVAMDPSNLFALPAEMANMYMNSDMASIINFDMAPWNEFLVDTQMDYSPGSGDSVSA